MLKDVAFDDGRAAPSDGKGVSVDVLPDIVYGVKDGPAAMTILTRHVRSPARGPSHKVANEGDAVVLPVKEHDPVVSIVARRRMIGPAVKLRVGYRQPAGTLAARDDKLPANVGKLAVVDPDVVRLLDRQAIATPDRLWIDGGNVDILQDDILDALDDESCTLQDALIANAEDGLV